MLYIFIYVTSILLFQQALALGKENLKICSESMYYKCFVFISFILLQELTDIHTMLWM